MRAPVHGRLAHVDGHEAPSSSLCAGQRPQAVTLVTYCIVAVDVARYLPIGQLARGGRRLGACARGVWAVPRGVVANEARVQPRNVEAVHVDAIKGFPAAARTARRKGLTRRRVSNRALSIMTMTTCARHSVECSRFSQSDLGSGLRTGASRTARTVWRSAAGQSMSRAQSKPAGSENMSSTGFVCTTSSDNERASPRRPSDSSVSAPSGGRKNTTAPIPTSMRAVVRAFIHSSTTVSIS